MSFGARYASGAQKRGIKKQLFYFLQKNQQNHSSAAKQQAPGTCSFVPPVAVLY